ncbi:MAG: hypothetical protein JWM68_5857 [Verrucomicrobiales bacterium]|nr:hypothetical protein [Verrucomicrobiales bacterium]
MANFSGSWKTFPHVFRVAEDPEESAEIISDLSGFPETLQKLFPGRRVCPKRSRNFRRSFGVPEFLPQINSDFSGNQNFYLFV